VTNKTPDDPLPARSEGAAEPTQASERMLALMETAITELPADTRTIFLLHRFRDLSYAQIAEAMNLSTSTVVRKMAEALERVAAAVEAGR
jgi:RNA polymerase sigma factor (sigma-70 family)